MTTHTLEESELLMKDSKYRVYVSAVDKALKNFEYTTEWADLIAALGKLNKVRIFRLFTLVVFSGSKNTWVTNTSNNQVLRVLSL